MANMCMCVRDSKGGAYCVHVWV